MDEIPALQVGDYWIYQMSHDGEVIATEGALVAAQDTIDGQAVFKIQSYVEAGDDGRTSGTIWVTPDEERIAVANAFPLEGRFRSAFGYHMYDEPCASRPPLDSEPFTRICPGWGHFVNDQGAVFGMRPMTRQVAVEVQGETTVEAGGRTVDAVEVQHRSTTYINGVGREVVGSAWYAAETCGIARLEVNEVVTTLLGYQCGQKSAGASFADAGLVPLPLLEADLETLRPSELTYTCTMRPMYVQVAGERQEVFASPCDVADQKIFDEGAIVGRLRAVAEWEGEESVIVEATLTVAGQSVSGATSPLEIEVFDVEGTFENLNASLAFEGVASAPQAQISFTFSEIHS